MSEPSYWGYRVATLERLPQVERGDVVSCDCGEQHVVHGVRNLFVFCGDAVRRAGVAGRLVLGTPPDAV